MKRLIAFLFTILIFHLANAQVNTYSFQGNNFIWNQATSNTLFHDADNGLPGFQVPATELNHAIFASTLWVGGINESDQIRVVGNGLRCAPNEIFCEWGPGPVRLNGTADSSGMYFDVYNKIWFVTSDQIEIHTAYYDCSFSPDCDIDETFPNGYDIPENILTWPAMGEVDAGYAPYLAPFMDRNNDGIYQPEVGDHPVFCGDFATYFISNDVAFPHSNTLSMPIGLEVHTMLYGYDSSEPAVFNTLFAQTKLIHRGTETLDDTYISSWTDFDLGNPVDDYIGTDVQRSMIYVMNGDAYDDGNTIGPGYGNDLPMVAVKFLAGPTKDPSGTDESPVSDLFETYGNQTSGYGDGIPDNERLGLAFSMAHHTTFPNEPTGSPDNTEQYYNYVRGIWNDGEQLTYGGLGYNVDASLVTKYLYPGNTDPLHIGTEGEDPNDPDESGWTEETVPNPPGDRRMLGSSGPFTFSPGDVQYFDYAFIFARDSHDSGTPVFQTLQSYADEIAHLYCDPLEAVLVSTTDNRSQDIFALYPNPATSSIQIELHIGSKGRYRILDITGKVILQGNLNANKTLINTGNLPSGLYLAQVNSGSNVMVQKLIIQ